MYPSCRDRSNARAGLDDGARRSRLTPLIQAEDLLERRRSLVGDALLEQVGHRVLPLGDDVLLCEVRARRLQVVGLEVAEDLVAVAEDQVVADHRVAQRLQHDGPDRRVGRDVLVDLLRLHVQAEGAPLRHVVSYALSTCATPRSRASRSAYPPARKASTGSASTPASVRSRASSGRTSASNDSTRTRWAPSTSPSACAADRRGSSTSNALAYAVWMFITDWIIASIFPSTLCDWSIMNATPSVPARAISRMIRNSSNGSTAPTIRSSSAYLRLLKWNPPSSPSERRSATICSTFVPCGWCPVSTRTCACGPSLRQRSAAVPQSGRSVA